MYIIARFSHEKCFIATLLHTNIRKDSGIVEKSESTENDGKRHHPPLVRVISYPQRNDEEC